MRAMTSSLFSVATVLFVIATVAHMLRVGASGRHSNAAPGAIPQPLPDRAERRRHLVWRSFYVNAADPRGWVRKTWGIGWTVNFRTLRNVRIFVALLAATIVSAVGLVVSVTR